MGRGQRGFDGVVRRTEIGHVRFEKVEVGEEEKIHEKEREGEAREEV